MQKSAFCLLLCCLTFQSYATVDLLKGYQYASEQAPKGNEWESPENLALNKEQPRAWFFSFQNLESARKVLPENSAYWAISERRLEIQLGPYARRTSEGFLSTLLRCIRLGQYPRAIQLEHSRSSERRDTEVWYPYLREPTGYLPAQSGCRRLAGRRDAYSTRKLDDL